MKILVTGASGLLGHKIVSLASKQGHEVHGTHYNHIPQGFANSHRLNLLDQDAVTSLVSKINPDVILHTASLTDVDQCELNRQLAMRVNGEMSGIVAEAARTVGGFLVYVSTDYVFDGREGSYKEDATPNPINVYGESKLEGEKAIARYSQFYCIGRTSVVYGWGREHRQNFATWLYDKLHKGERVNAITDQFVSPTLNTNLASMLLEAAERRLQGIFHLAGSTRVSRFEFAAKLAEKCGFDKALVIPALSSSMNWKATRPRDSSLNVSKALETLNNKPLPIDEALRQFASEEPRL